MAQKPSLKAKILGLQSLRSMVFLSIISLLIVSPASAQWMLINQGGGVPDSSAALEIRDTTRGFLLPRLSQAQINSITNPSQGLMMFNTDSNYFVFYNGSSFSTIVGTQFSDQDGDTRIELEENSDDDTVRIYAGGKQWLTLSPSGNLGLGISNTGADFVINDTNTVMSLVSTTAGWSRIHLVTPSSDHILVSGLGQTRGFGVVDWKRSRTLLAIDSIGNVGIGSNTPTSKLQVTTSAPLNANSGQLQIEESTTNKVMFVGRTENYGYVQTQGATPLSLNPISNPVGAGITNPKAAFQQGSVTGLLTAIGNAHFTGNLYHDGSNWRRINTGKAGFIHIEPGTGSIGLYTVPASGAADAVAQEFKRMTIDSTGNVGINYNNPGERLEVTGGVKADSLISDRMTSSSTGNANLIPVAYGRVTGAGGVTLGTGNFTITKFGTGSYRVVRTTGTFAGSSNVVLVTPEANANARTATYVINSGNIEIHMWQSNTNALVDNQFSFLVYEF